MQNRYKMEQELGIALQMVQLRRYIKKFAHNFKFTQIPYKEYIDNNTYTYMDKATGKTMEDTSIAKKTILGAYTYR